MAACGTNLNRQIVVYILIGFVSHVVVDGRMKCTSYYCAGGNFGLVGDDYGKRSVVIDNNIVRREAPFNHLTDITRRRIAVDPMPDTERRESEIDRTRRLNVEDQLRSLLGIRSAGARWVADSAPQRALRVFDGSYQFSDAVENDESTTSRRQRPSTVDQFDDVVDSTTGDDVDRLRRKLLETWLNEVDTKTLRAVEDATRRH